jgi:hypothetical protein
MENEARQVILNFYKEIGGDQEELYFASDWFSGASYKVARKGHGYVNMRRMYMDDYLDSKNEPAEKFIKGILERLLKKEAPPRAAIYP